jgi:hypothetical protein
LSAFQRTSFAIHKKTTNETLLLMVVSNKIELVAQDSHKCTICLPRRSHCLGVQLHVDGFGSFRSSSNGLWRRWARPGARTPACTAQGCHV